MLVFPFALLIRSASGRMRIAGLALLLIGMPMVGHAAGLALPDVWERASLVLALVIGWSVSVAVRSYPGARPVVRGGATNH